MQCHVFTCLKTISLDPFLCPQAKHALKVGGLKTLNVYTGQPSNPDLGGCDTEIKGELKGMQRVSCMLWRHPTPLCTSRCCHDMHCADTAAAAQLAWLQPRTLAQPRPRQMLTFRVSDPQSRRLTACAVTERPLDPSPLHVRKPCRWSYIPEELSEVPSCVDGSVVAWYSLPGAHKSGYGDYNTVRVFCCRIKRSTDSWESQFRMDESRRDGLCCCAGFQRQEQLRRLRRRAVSRGEIENLTDKWQHLTMETISG